MLHFILAVLLLLTAVFLFSPAWRAVLPIPSPVPDGGGSETPLQGGRVLIIGVALFISIAAFALYHFVGAPEVVPLLKAHEEKMEGLAVRIAAQSDAVKAEPKNLAAWVELGGSFAQAGQYAASANAFKRAVVLSDGDPRLILAYARALIFSEEGIVGDHAKKSLEMVLLQDPENEEARYFLAVRKLQDGNTEDAMQAMKVLYRSLPEDSPVRRMIDGQIGK